MILNSIFLHLDGRDFPPDMCLKLKDQSRCITYFMQREVKKKKYFIEKFNRIVIQPSRNPDDDIFINSEAVASISTAFDAERFIESSDAERGRYYTELIEDGLRAFHEKFEIPLPDMLAAMEHVAANGFVAHWTHQEKSAKRLGICAKLMCSMNMDAFHLDLEIARKERVIFRDTILKTPPDEVAFHHKFKDIVIGQESVRVTSRMPSDGPLVDVKL